MIRTCNGQDPNLVDEAGLPCACGLTFDDVERMVVFPHQVLPPKLSLEELEDRFPELRELFARAGVPGYVDVEPNRGPLTLADCHGCGEPLVGHDDAACNDRMRRWRPRGVLDALRGAPDHPAAGPVAAGDGLAALTEIVKRRYETGEYGNAHFKVPRAVLELMREQVPAPRPGTYAPPRLPGYSIGDLMGIPVVVDDELPAGRWRLVDNSTGKVLHEGTVDIPPREE